jgi:hypothetical protein
MGYGGTTWNVLRYELAAQKKFDWALQNLLESRQKPLKARL